MESQFKNKSKSGYRDVPLTEEAIVILKSQKEKLKMIKVMNMQFSDIQWQPDVLKVGCVQRLCK